MARVSESFAGKWMNASDIGRGIRTTISEVTEEEVGQGAEKKIKLVCWFKDQDKGLVLNKTNGTILAEIYGDETDDWAGKRVILKTQKVEFAGRRVDGIRIDEDATKSAAQSAIGAPTKKPAPPVTQQEVDDNVPW